MRYLTEKEYLALNDPYLEHRWGYFSAAISMLKEEQPTSVLELGPYRRSLAHGADTMDVVAGDFVPTYLHDATEYPWPIPDNRYDMFVALQVWEHLKNSQRDAFREVMRISNKAILSFPLNWYCPGNIHHGITEEIIADWTLHVQPEKKEIVGSRIIYLFKFK
jgi:hypothetical protein